MPFPGNVKIGPPTKKLSLSEAYKLFQMTEVTFCHCKKACSTKQCRCYVKGQRCSSRCYKTNTKNCNNNSEESSIQETRILQRKSMVSICPNLEVN